jgi:hypothetical protein
MALKTIRGEVVDMPAGAVMGAEMIDPQQRNWTYPVQMYLPIASKPTLTEQVRRVLLAYEWITLLDVQSEILARTGEMHSDSSISARVRDLRKTENGGYLIVKRKKENSIQYEYRMEGLA